MRSVLRMLLLLVGIYLAAAYLILPRLWHHYAHQPALAGAPKVTATDAGVPGDPLNVGVVGTREEVL